MLLGLLDRAELGTLNRVFELRNTILTRLGRPPLPRTPVVIVTISEDDSTA